MPPGIMERVKAKSEAAGIDWSRWSYNDNTCKPQVRGASWAIQAWHDGGVMSPRIIEVTSRHGARGGSVRTSEENRAYLRRGHIDFFSVFFSEATISWGMMCSWQ